MPEFLRYLDARGQRWRVYAFRVTAGHITYGHPGRPGSAYRGFVPEGGGARRTYLILGSLGEAELATDDATLERQLAAAVIYFLDDPDHPLNRTRPAE